MLSFSSLVIPRLLLLGEEKLSCICIEDSGVVLKEDLPNCVQLVLDIDNTRVFHFIRSEGVLC